MPVTPSCPKLAVHKFSSCDGCQLALLNLGEALLDVYAQFDVLHFAEAGQLAPDSPVDVALVEGSISTPDEAERIRKVRESSRFLIAIGACATSGGIQALRNSQDADAWRGAVYAHPEHIEMLAQSKPVSEHVKVDMELWGCPVTSRQLVAALRALLEGVTPVQSRDKVCMECKRRGVVCVLVAKGEPCMGPLTGTGCGALCPAFGRDCYGCFGPAEGLNTESLGQRLRGLGLPADALARRFLSISNGATPFRDAAERWTQTHD